ncbi:MAG: molybdopterin oxidoreductase family protein, partial [Acidimicrobiales bacterium]
STCTACSVGCRIAVQASSNRLVRKLGVDVDPVNWGWLCDKGRFDFEAVNSDDRLGTPLVREAGQEDLAPTSWADALARATEGISQAKLRRGSDSIAMLGGARCTNEDAYAWAKLARTVLGTDSIDAQLGDGLPAETVLGLPRATIDSACAADTILLLGPDLKEELPVLYLRLRHAVVEGGATLVELSPTATGMTRYATVSLRYRPGEASALMRSLLAQPGAAQGNGQSAELDQAAELLRRGSLVCVLGRPSLAEPAQPVVDAAASLLDALPETTFLPALRRSNVMGALDMGLAPGVLPGRVLLDGGRRWFTREWGSLPAEPGLDAEGILTAAAEGRVGCLILLGADPLADFPDRDLARRALAGTGFTLAVDCFLTDSSRRADVVLPAAAFGERSGTTTNIEGRVSRLHQKITPPGTARADWMIAVELAARLGGDLGFGSVEDVTDEIEQVAPSHRGLTRARLASPEGFDGLLAGGLTEGADEGAPPAMAQTDAPGVSGVAGHLKVDTLALTAMGSAERPDPQARRPTPGEPATSPHGGDAGGGPSRPPLLRWTGGGAPGGQAPPLDRYSLRLVASRQLYDDGTLVHHSPSLAPLAPGCRLRIHPGDLQPLGVTSGARLQVTSSHGRVVLEVVADPGVPQGSAALAFNQPGPGAADLIDASRPVTEVRLETLSAGSTDGVTSP